MGNRPSGVNILLFLIYFGVCQCTLTTAVIKDNTSPKPVYRRFNMASIKVDAKYPDQIDVLDGRRKNSKKGKYVGRNMIISLEEEVVSDDECDLNIHYCSQIWDWDSWCLLQPKEGNCEQNLQRFYYNRQLEKCLPFVYSGCNANENNFKTKVDCEVRCAGVTSTMNSRGIDQGLLCQYQPDVGACLAFETKYYFDINRNTCSKFVYGGCAGNVNRFETKFDCRTTCERQNE